MTAERFVLGSHRTGTGMEQKLVSKWAHWLEPQHPIGR